MTEIDELLQTHGQSVPIHDDVERDALDRARRALRAAIVAGPAPAARHRRGRRPRRLALIAGVAAAIVAIVASLPLGSGHGVGRLGPATASARIVIERAAQAISRQAWHPLKPGEWLYFRQLRSNRDHDGPVPARANSVDQVWVAANGAARIVQHPGVVTAGDVLLSHQPRRKVLAEQRRQRLGSHLRVMADRWPYSWWPGADYQQLIHMPTNPADLRRWIERNAIDPGSTCADGGSDCNLFTFVEALLTAGPLPPRLSAALYRVIATLPGMRLIGPTHDPLGRPGVAVGYFFAHQPGRLELIFDPTTGVFLGERGISLDAKKQGAPPGTVVEWSAIVDQGLVHSDHERPRSDS